MLKIILLTTSPEKILSRLVASGLDFYSPEKCPSGMSIEISVFSFFAFKRLAGAYNIQYNVTALGIFGGFLRKKHRIGLFIGAVIGIFLIYLSTFFVWSVKIEGEGDIPEREILETLERHGFHEGVLKGRVDVNEVAQSFLADRAEFSFCSINVSGAVAYVELHRREPVRYSEPESDAYNLISDADGVVVRVEVENGISEVGVGDSVFRGQLVVSGIMENSINTAFRLVRAEGRIWARVEKLFEFSVPLEYTEKKYVKEKEVSLLRVLGHRIGFMRLPRDGEYDIISSIEKPEVFGRELPFGIEKILYAFYSEKTVTLTESEALIRAHDLYRKRALTEFDACVVEEESFSHRIENGCLILECRVTVIDDICTRQKIEVE